MKALVMDAVECELLRKRGEKLPYKRRNPASFR
jgi:hypothetical protein